MPISHLTSVHVSDDGTLIRDSIDFLALVEEENDKYTHVTLGQLSLDGMIAEDIENDANFLGVEKNGKKEDWSALIAEYRKGKGIK